MGGNEPRPRAPHDRARRWAMLSLAVVAVAARAQSGPSEPAPPPSSPPPATTPAPSPSPAPSPAAKGAQLDTVQVTGSRPDDVQERRQSTAAKIIVGREEIDRFGDSTLGEVLKRLPGVTIQGRPGRGGAIRLRGLGNGYTQILLDGERVPPGFSLDSLTPDQIERIEILRAPTAETGARAIAGTINIITRGGYSRRVNDVRVTLGYENGAVQPALSWTRNFSTGPFIVNYSISAYHCDQDGSSVTRTIDRRLDGDEAVLFDQTDDGRYRSRGNGVNASARLQWRGEGGVDAVTLIPFLAANRFRFHREGTLSQGVPDPALQPPFYERALSEGSSGSDYARLNGEWTHRFGSGGRTEFRAGLGQSRQPYDAHRVESGGSAPNRYDDRSDARDTTYSLSLKLVETLFDEHSLVAGAEIEGGSRKSTVSSLQNGVPVLTDFGDRISASSTRVAAYAQDEFNLSPNWAAHAGLRWEGIATQGSVNENEPDAKNRSSVWTPLLHAVWKPDPKGRDQVRFSLTRSYRAPLLGNLIARPRVNARYPVSGPNTPTQPDRAGNPDLKPELATGVDIAFEHYLPGSGILSANVFRRDLSDYMRSVTSLENVSYSPVPRYVLRLQNVGKATTEGLELEAKFRASDLWAQAPPLDVRANASFFRSRVRGVPGPDNRLDQQPDYTANLGVDHRFRAWPLTVGGNLNYTPGYETRLSDVQRASISGKLGLDLYALWVFNPGLQLRLTLSNVDRRDYVTASSFDFADGGGRPVRETATNVAPTFVDAQLRLEMKL